MKFTSIAAILLFAATFAACSGGKVSVGVNADPRGWKQEDIKTLVYQNNDTTSMRDIVVFISCNSYIDSVIPMEITIVTPDSLRFSEKFMFEPTGSENGGDFKVRRAVYRTGSLFSHEGGYVFRIRHLGHEPLKGIRAVGIEIDSRAKD